MKIKTATAPEFPEIERRQTRLQVNAEAIERWQRKLFRAARELEKLVKERKRLLYPRKPGGKYTPMEPIGLGGKAVDGELNDDLPVF